MSESSFLNRHLFLLSISILSAGLLRAQDFPLLAEGFDSHVELRWEQPAGPAPAQYVLWRASAGSPFVPVKTVGAKTALDFTGYPGDTPVGYQYYVAAMNLIQQVVAVSDTVTVAVSPADDAALLDMVQRYTFRYFWDFAHPVSGMARERNTSGDIVTTGGTGFGIMAVLVGIERGFISREQGLFRLLQLVSFLQVADRFHGVFPHWMDGNTGNTVPFSQYDDGADLVETAFLMQGLLCARAYFDAEDPYEDALRQAVTGLWEAVEWDFFRKNGTGVLYWHWSPNYGWQMNLPVRGYNEALAVYLLAIASPTHPVPASLWNSGWAGPNYTVNATWYGYPLEVGPSLGGPLFFSHYSFLGFDPRDKRDAFTNYFVRNRHHTLINRAYCIANPLNNPGYSADCWGLTASDNPWGYLAHEPGAGKDNGTIAPTAALSSMPYTPTESMAALKHFYRNLGASLWGPMGFYDAFNLKVDWFADSYLAIDQGPILCMLENHRTRLLWNLFMANPEIQPALDAIGFAEDLTDLDGRADPPAATVRVFPNPGMDRLTVVLATAEAAPWSLSVMDAQGRPLVSAQVLPADGEVRTITLETAGWPAGLYFVRLVGPAGVRSLPWVKVGG